jgi:hypothetical protein
MKLFAGQESSTDVIKLDDMTVAVFQEMLRYVHNKNQEFEKACCWFVSCSDEGIIEIGSNSEPVIFIPIFNWNTKILRIF